MIPLVLGLGNPGPEYKGTRHNLGFDLVDCLCGRFDAQTSRVTDRLVECKITVDDHQVILAKPMTYMNLSGLAAEDLLQHHSLLPENFLVVIDDLSLPLGTLRLREEGSDGGHNGLVSLIERLQTDQFPRLRLGIGPVADRIDAAEFVLDRFEEDEIDPVEKMIETAADAVTYAISHPLDEVMSKYNRPPALPE